MVKLPAISIFFYRAYLRSRLERCSRDLQVIAAQRENDALAECVLIREAESVRSKLRAL